MYRILLADDEAAALDTLPGMLAEMFPEGCIVETASSGKEAVQKSAALLPDLVLFNLEMREGNGREAVSEIRKACPNIRIILLAAQGESNGSEMVLPSGIYPCLNKPATPVRIAEALRSTFTQREKGRANRQAEVQETPKNVIAALENDLICDIVFHEERGEELLTYKMLLNIEENGGYIMCIACREPGCQGEWTGEIGASIKDAPFYLNMKEIVQSCCRCVVGPAMPDKVVVFVPQEPADEYTHGIDAANTAKRVYARLKKGMGTEFRIGVGSYQPAFGQLCRSYDEALMALRCASLPTVCFHDLPEEPAHKDDVPVAWEQSFLEKCRNEDGHACNDFARIFDRLVQAKGKSPFEVRMKLLELVFQAERAANSNGAAAYGVPDKKGCLKTVMAMETYAEVGDWCMEKILAAVNCAANHKKNKAGQIAAAKSFINNYYCRGITLEDVSREVNLSPYYFSKLFKAETGENFIDYLTDIRIAKAKQLLHNKELSIKEICYTIGYSDPNYFSRNFKKIVGLTPTEFRGRL